LKKPKMERIPDLEHPFPLTEMNTARCMAMELKWFKQAYQCSADATETITLANGEWQPVCEYHYEEWAKFQEKKEE
jgi:hypothetical protein